MKPIRILLVEDNPGDVRLIREAFREAQVESRLLVVSDGVEAIDLLSNAVEGPPDLILMDLEMPRVDGQRLLQTIKSDSRWSLIPVVVLTSSAAERDILRSYGMHANCYVTKPHDLERFIEVIRAVHTFWTSVATLPGSIQARIDGEKPK